MAVPKKRTSKSKRDMRRSHHHVVAVNSVVCPKCGEPTLRHRACPGCGQYRGRQAIEIPAQSSSSGAA